MKLALTTLALALAQAGSSGGGSGAPDRSMLIWAVVAFGLAILLVVVEAFMPSGGIIGVLAGVCAIVGIVLFFRFDTMWGLVSMALTLLALPFLLMGLLWVWPNTPIGRALTLDDEPTSAGSDAPGADAPAVSVGQEGTALTDLRPVGACRLSGRRLDCISHAGVIPSGTAVRVIAVEGTTVKVKPV